MANCVPLKITAHLLDGRVNSASGLIMFDAILYHAWFAKYEPQVLEGIYDYSKAKFIGLPLRRLEGNRWAASKGIYQEVLQEIENYNKRPDFFAGDKIDYLADTKGQISGSVGKYRAYRIPQLIRTVKDNKIVFYAVGNKPKIEDLLSYMTAVGKKPAIGFGVVTKWEVEEIDEDYTTEHPDYGLMRPIPVEEAEKKYSCPVMLHGVKPPYWKSKNAKLCYVPIGRSNNNDI